MKKKKLKIVCCVLTPIIILTLSIFYQIGSIPTTLFIREGQHVKISPLLTSGNPTSIIASSNVKAKNQERKLDINLLGMVKVKSIYLKEVSDKVEVFPGGQPIGVKLNTKGVLVVALSDIDTGKGKVISPASSSGIQIGDSILKINNNSIKSCEEASNVINNCKGKDINILIDRNGEQLLKKVVPVKSLSDNKYKIGLWIRDSTAGVGTLTFYDPKANKFAALGHPITDIDTGTILKVNTGNLINSSIISVRRGQKGSPGELRGIFVNEANPIGTISKNTQCGIFGEGSKELINEKFNKPMKVALRNEIKEGPAQILTTIDGDTPKTFNIVIEKLLQQEYAGPKSMVIRVTDPVLLEKTGGIVQGMSGSPIIQDGKLVGAVTHVLVNKPDTGYGIYIEWMLKDADVLSQ